MCDEASRGRSNWKKTLSTEPRIQLLRVREVATRTGLSRSGVYLRVKRGEFPAPVRLSHRVSAWSAAEIDAWCAARLAERASPETDNS